MSKRYPSRPKRPNNNPKDKKGGYSGLFSDWMNPLADYFDQLTRQDNQLVNPLRPTVQNGPNNNGFGGVSYVGSTGLGDASNGTAYNNPNIDYSAVANTELGIGQAAWQLHHGGNMLDFIAALNANNKLTEANLPFYLQALLQYGATVDQRTYDQQATQDQRQYDQRVLQDQREYDWNLTQDQRSYDRSVLEDQRQFDSPTNQLARLMGAGISRDAAIQMLSGGSSAVGGSGSPVVSGGLGSGSPFAGSSPSIGASGGSESPITKAVQIIDAICGLVNLGFDVPVAIQSAQNLKNQNYLSGSQIDAYQSASSAFDVLYGANASPDAFRSVKDALDTITNLANNGDQNAITFISSGGFDKLKRNSAFASPVLSSLYKSERSSKDYAEQYSLSIRKQQADIAISQVQYDKLSQEVLNSSAEYDQIVANTDYINAMTVTCKALGLNYDANTALVNEQTLNMSLENQSLQSLYNSQYNGRSYFDWRNDDVLGKLVTDAMIASKTTNPDYVDSVYSQMFNTAQSVGAAMALQALKDQSGLKFSSEHPQQFYLWNALNSCGAYDYIEAKLKAKSSRHGGNQIWSGSKEDQETLDILEPETYSPSFFERVKKYFLYSNHIEE